MPPVKFCLADIPLRSTRKISVFIIYKNIFWIKISKKRFYLILKKPSLNATRRRLSHGPGWWLNLPAPGITCKYSSAFQYSEPCRVAIRYPMPDPKEGLQLSCSCQNQDIILTHAVVLDHD